MEVFVDLRFEAAHRLPNVPPEHRCARMHGHSYLVTIHVEGDADPRTGWVIDFADLQAAAMPLIEQLDHHVINEVRGLENPTAENIARWLWQGLASSVKGLSRVVVVEGQGMGAAYRG